MFSNLSVIGPVAAGPARAVTTVPAPHPQQTIPTQPLHNNKGELVPKLAGGPHNRRGSWQEVGVRR